jgi:CheY-like chemotaxis protein
MAKVLCAGADRILVETRVLILRGAGHTAVPAMGDHEILAACQEDGFDVVVIGQANMPKRDKQRVLEIVRQHCSDVKVLELYSPATGRSLKSADAWLEVPALVPTDLALHVERLATK